MEEVQKHLYVLILAGGGGTRLWPMSREKSPKQFLKLFSGKSLFKLTLARALELTSKDKIFISTSEKYATLVKKEAKSIPAENIISEPIRRDTALAQGLGALVISNRDPEAVIVNLASDHLITPTYLFIKNMRQAAKIAFTENKFVTVGIKPLFPNTGMGHIKIASGNIGKKFVEKPDLKTAEKFTQSGEYLWNANLYVWKAKLILNLLKKYSPKTVAQFANIAKALGTGKEREALQLGFQMAPSISIDYAVSEKMTNFVCLQAEFSWTDIGNWREVYKSLEKDKLDNVIYADSGRGKFIGIDTTKSLFMLQKKLVVSIGVDNLLVIDTPDAILICKADDNQAVKKVVETLKEQKLTEYL